jgi:Fic family protein
MKVPQSPPYVPQSLSYPGILDELGSLGRKDEFLSLEASRYFYWDKWKFVAEGWGVDPKKIWFLVKMHRLNSRKIVISDVEKFSFLLRIPLIAQQDLHELDKNLGGSLQAESIIPSVDRERYLISSLMEEAIASSQLEGAATTRKKAKQMLEENRKPRNNSEQMIVNNYMAMKWIVENRKEDFTAKNICSLHQILTRNTLSHREEEGAFRQDNEIRVVDNQTGKTLYTPPPFELLEQLIEDYCRFANSTEKGFFLHPIEKGIILHFIMGYIHPFVDGNGRTARTIFYWYLLKHDYWLIEYMSVSRIILNAKAQYARAYLYTELDENDLTYFIVYNLKCIRLALEQLRTYIGRKQAEKQQMLYMLRNTDYNDRQIEIIQEIMRDSTAMFTVQQIETKFDVSNQTARNDLNALVEQGVLEARKSGKKVQFLTAPGYIKALKK